MIQEQLSFLKNKKVLIFDLETTGLPLTKPGREYMGKYQYYKYTLNHKYDSSRIVQIAWAFIEDFDFDKLDEATITSFIRKPLDFDNIPVKSTKIHGITFENAKTNGTVFGRIINGHLSDCIANTDYIMAHNAFFDINILMNELHRIGFNNCIDNLNKLIDDKKVVCTAEIGRDIMCSDPYYPKLTTLYYYYYKVCPIKAHDAGADVKTIIGILMHKEVKQTNNIEI